LHTDDCSSEHELACAQMNVALNMNWPVHKCRVSCGVLNCMKPSDLEILAGVMQRHLNPFLDRVGMNEKQSTLHPLSLFNLTVELNSSTDPLCHLLHTRSCQRFFCPSPSLLQGREHHLCR